MIDDFSKHIPWPRHPPPLVSSSLWFFPLEPPRSRRQEAPIRPKCAFNFSIYDDSVIRFVIVCPLTMSNNDRWKLQDGRAAQDDDVLPAPPLRRNSKDKHLHNRERRRLKRRRILTKLLSSCLLRFQARATRPTIVADPTPRMTPMSFLLVSSVVAYLDDDLHDRPDVCAENPARATPLPIPETYKENGRSTPAGRGPQLYTYLRTCGIRRDHVSNNSTLRNFSIETTISIGDVCDLSHCDSRSRMTVHIWVISNDDKQITTINWFMRMPRAGMVLTSPDKQFHFIKIIRVEEDWAKSI